VLAAQERIPAVRRGLEAAGQSLRLSRDRFEGGVGLDLEVLEAQEALTDTRTAVIGAVVDYDVAQLRLILALGDVTAERLVDGFH
jgi:outer membrane protein TolC